MKILLVLATIVVAVQLAGNFQIITLTLNKFKLVNKLWTFTN